MTTQTRQMYHVHWSRMECFVSFQVLAKDTQDALSAFDRACAYHHDHGSNNEARYDHSEVTVTCWTDKPHMHKHWEGSGYFVYAGPYRY